MTNIGTGRVWSGQSYLDRHIHVNQNNISLVSDSGSGPVYWTLLLSHGCSFVVVHESRTSSSLTHPYIPGVLYFRSRLEERKSPSFFVSVPD